VGSRLAKSGTETAAHDHTLRDRLRRRLLSEEGRHGRLSKTLVVQTEIFTYSLQSKPERSKSAAMFPGEEEDSARLAGLC
jgi:hypothetical protein